MYPNSAFFNIARRAARSTRRQQDWATRVAGNWANLVIPPGPARTGSQSQRQPKARPTSRPTFRRFCMRERGGAGGGGLSKHEYDGDDVEQARPRPTTPHPPPLCPFLFQPSVLAPGHLRQSLARQRSACLARKQAEPGRPTWSRRSDTSSLFPLHFSATLSSRFRREGRAGGTGEANSRGTRRLLFRVSNAAARPWY